MLLVCDSYVYVNFFWAEPIFSSRSIMPDSQEEPAKQENEEAPSPISALASMIEKLSFQVHSLHEDVSGIADRMDVIDNKQQDIQHKLNK